MQNPKVSVLDCDIHGQGNAITSLHTHLPKLGAQRSHMGHADPLGPEFFQQLCDAQTPRLHIRWQGQ